VKLLLSCAAALGLLAQAPPLRLGDPLPGHKPNPEKAFESVRTIEHEGRKLLVDSAGIVRRIFTPNAPVEEETRLWTLGRDLWRDTCARCHGLDGGDTHYPGTRPMRGYGNNKTDAMVRRKIELSSTVDTSRLKDHEMSALAIFVRGL
jgi:hypothetical protein